MLVITRIPCVTCIALLFLAANLQAQDTPPTRAEFDHLVGEVESLKAERDKLADELGSRNGSLDAAIDSYLENQHEPGTNRVLLTGFAFATFRNMEGMDSTFDAAFVPIFLWQPNDRILFEAEVEFGLDEEETEVELGYAQISFIVNDYVTIGFGKFLIPFGTFWERWHPPWINKLPTMPLVYMHHGGIVGESLLGIQVRGGAPVGATAKVNYAFYVANGPSLGEEGHNAGSLEWERNLDNNNNKSVGGRFGILPVPHVELGISFLVGDVGDSGTGNQNVGTTLLGIDFWYGDEIEALAGRLEIRAEFIWNETDDATVEDQNGTPFLFTSNRRTGWFVQGAWRPTRLEGMVRNLEVVVRFDLMQRPGADEGGIDTRRITLGVNYWFLSNAVAKLAWFRDEFSEGPARDGVLFQIAVGF